MKINRKEFKNSFDKFASTIPERFSNGDYKKYLWIEYDIGGASGGNCWNDDDPQEYENYIEREKMIPENFYTFLSKYFNNIQIKEINYFLHKLNWFSDTRQVNEYYGNYTIYEYKYISSNVLYDFLVELELIDED